MLFGSSCTTISYSDILSNCELNYHTRRGNIHNFAAQHNKKQKKLLQFVYKRSFHFYLGNLIEPIHTNFPEFLLLLLIHYGPDMPENKVD